MLCACGRQLCSLSAMSIVLSELHRHLPSIVGGWRARTKPLARRTLRVYTSQKELVHMCLLMGNQRFQSSPPSTPRTPEAESQESEAPWDQSFRTISNHTTATAGGLALQRPRSGAAQPSDCSSKNTGRMASPSSREGTREGIIRGLRSPHPESLEPSSHSMQRLV